MKKIKEQIKELIEKERNGSLGLGVLESEIYALIFDSLDGIINSFETIKKHEIMVEKNKADKILHKFISLASYLEILKNANQIKEHDFNKMYNLYLNAIDIHGDLPEGTNKI